MKPKPIYVCDLHADIYGFRLIRFAPDTSMRCKLCMAKATQVVDENTPPNDVCDD
jgi:hypothetical protein